MTSLTEIGTLQQISFAATCYIHNLCNKTMTQRFLLLNFRVAAESAFDSFFTGKMAKDSSAENVLDLGSKG